jgi:type VI secretion system protein ImpL
MPKSLINWLRRKPAHSLKEALAIARLRALKHNIQDAMRFLSKVHLKKVSTPKQLPWYLVIGSTNTGKTTLLAKSELALISTNGKPLEHILPTAYCQWFFGKEAIFIDSAGSLLLPEQIDTATLNLWKKFIALLYRHHHYHPLDGLILCIDLLDFQEKSFEQRKQYIDVLRHHIHAFPYAIPIYLLFTRCDRVQGFTEFFQAFSIEEREQTCGISLAVIEQQNFAEYLDQQFNAFLLRLNQQIFGCLQRERSIEKRIHIKNFPLQLEAQKRHITQLSDQLHSTRNPLRGIYFTSSQQEGAQNDALSPLLDTFGFPALANNTDRPLQQTTFFIKDTLKKIISFKQDIAKPNRGLLQKLQKPINSQKFYPILASVFSLLALGVSASYFYNQHAITQVRTILTAYQLQQQNNPQANPLALVDTLRQAKDEVKHAANPLTSLVFHQAKYLNSQLDSLYNKALVSTFAVTLEKILAKQLQADIQAKSIRTLNTLKIYLMMVDADHRQLNFIDAWFAKQLQTTSKENAEHNPLFMQHLHVWLAQNAPAFKIDIKLVNASRELLRGMPPNDLVLFNLKQKYLPTDHHNPLYDAKNFPAITERDIPQLVEQFIKNEAWVLGDTPADSLTPALIAQLTRDVQQRYTANYVEFWTGQLSNLTIPAFKNLHEARAFIVALQTNHSVPLEALKTIQANLAPIALTAEGQKLTALLQKTQDSLTKNKLSEATNTALKKLLAYIDEILASKNSENATFIATQKRMQDSDKDVITQLLTVSKAESAPLDNWLDRLAINVWKAMLQVSQDHLNAIWMTDVLPQYQTKILNHYPVFKNNSAAETSLADFTSFFGPTGAMETFFKKNLSLFADTSALYWQWKVVNGVHINIPQPTLEMFNRASLIKKMYFSEETKALQVKFTVTPTNVELISDNFVLTLAGQSVSYTTDFRQAKQFIWPGKTAAYAALERQEGTNKRIFYEEKGEWAVFKLFAHAALATSHNPKLYQLEFHADNHQVTYETLAENTVNPFMPDIISEFRCPDRL